MINPAGPSLDTAYGAASRTNPLIAVPGFCHVRSTLRSSCPVHKPVLSDVHGRKGFDAAANTHNRGWLVFQTDLGSGWGGAAVLSFKRTT